MFRVFSRFIVFSFSQKVSWCEILKRCCLQNNPNMPLNLISAPRIVDACISDVQYKSNVCCLVEQTFKCLVERIGNTALTIDHIQAKMQLYKIFFIFLFSILRLYKIKKNKGKHVWSKGKKGIFDILSFFGPPKSDI